MSPTSRPVNTPSTDSATVPSAPVSPSRLAIVAASSYGRRGDQPDLLAGVEVHLRQRAGARPDLVGDDLVEDLLADGDEFRGGPALDERQRLAPARGDVVAVLPAGELELGLRVGESGQIAVGEVLAGGQSAREVHQRRALHERVVDVEERGRGQIRRRRGGARPRPRRGARRRPRRWRRRPTPARRLRHHRERAPLNPRTPGLPDTGCREPSAGGVADQAGCIAVRADRGAARPSWPTSSVSTDGHRRRRRGRRGGFRAARRVRRPAAGGAARRREHSYWELDEPRLRADLGAAERAVRTQSD